MSDHLRDITKMLKPCPFCGKHDVGIVRDADLYFAVCYDCGARIDYYDSEEEAAAAWNHRAKPENKPLTWDELKEMGEYEPVWIECGYDKGWYIIQGFTFYKDYRTQSLITDDGDYWDKDTLNVVWFAYRRKHEEERNLRNLILGITFSAIDGLRVGIAKICKTIVTVMTFAIKEIILNSKKNCKDCPLFERENNFTYLMNLRKSEREKILDNLEGIEIKTFYYWLFKDSLGMAEYEEE